MNIPQQPASYNKGLHRAYFDTVVANADRANPNGTVDGKMTKDELNHTGSVVLHYRNEYAKHGQKIAQQTGDTNNKYLQAAREMHQVFQGAVTLFNNFDRFAGGDHEVSFKDITTVATFDGVNHYISPNDVNQQKPTGPVDTSTNRFGYQYDSPHWS